MPDASVISNRSMPNDRGFKRAMLFGLWGAPAAWILQFVTNYAVTSNACYPGANPLPVPRGNYLTPIVIIVNVLAIVIAVAAALSAMRALRVARSEPRTASERALREGSRTRFVGLCGVMMSLGILAVLVFDALAIFTVPPCTG